MKSRNLLFIAITALITVSLSACTGSEEKVVPPGNYIVIQTLDLQDSVYAMAGGFRGLESNPSLAQFWAAGSKGMVIHWLETGPTSVFQYDSTYELRDIVPLDSHRCLLLSVTSPAEIIEFDLRDSSWQTRYHAEDSLAFLDDLQLDGDTVWAYGDPLDGYHYVLRSIDRGLTWNRIDSALLPKPLSDEAGFAASGASIARLEQGKLRIGTSGESPRILATDDGGVCWTAYNTPMPGGAAMRGIYAMRFRDELHGVAVGGEWGQDSVPMGAMWTSDGGKSWTPSGNANQYRSGVCWVGGRSWLSCGPQGIARSDDDGHSWYPISDLHLYALDWPGESDLVFGSGPEARIVALFLNDRVQN
jgi:photosystem II stability/assembly factor-like uncharacterized protein